MAAFLELPFGRIVKAAAAVLHALEKMLSQSSPTSYSRQLLSSQLVLRLVQGMSQHGFHAEVAFRASVAFHLLLAYVGNPAAQLFRVARLAHLDFPRSIANVSHYRRQLRHTPASSNYSSRSPHCITKY